GPLTKTLSFAVAGRRSWIDATLPLFTSSTFHLSPAYYDYQARLTWRPTARDVCDLFVWRSGDLLSLLARGEDDALDLLVLGSGDRLSSLASVKDAALNAAVHSPISLPRAVADWLHRFDRG